MEIDYMRLLSFVVSLMASFVWGCWGYKKHRFETAFAFVTVLLHSALYLGAILFFDIPHTVSSQWAIVLRLHTLLVLMVVPIHFLIIDKMKGTE